MIKPRGNPEIIFWVEPRDLPNDTDIYATCKKYNVGFMVGISPGTFNNTKHMSRYKFAIANQIKLHFLTVTPQEELFANIYNTKEHLDLFKDHKQWFIDEGIYSSEYIESFALDAEPPSSYTEQIKDEGVIDSVNYYIDNYPTEEEIEKAEEDLKEFVRIAHSDGKKAGIVRIISYMDEMDGDGDIEIFLRNIYSLDVKYDYSVTMIYRTERIVAGEGDSAEVVLKNVMGNIFGDVPAVESEENVLPAYNFYNRVGIEQTKSEINTDKRYIFIGTMKEEFNGTDYVDNKEYLEDIDICRHFKSEKIFIYNYENFVNYYGEEELENMGRHIEKAKEWELDYYTAETLMTILFYVIIAVIDRLLFLDPTSY